MTSRRSLLLAFASVAAIVAAEKASATYIPFTRQAFNALDYNILGNGVTNDAAAINTFLTTASTSGAVAFFPAGKTYNLGGSQITVPDGTTVACGTGATFTRSTDPGSAGSWSTTYGAYTGTMISLGNYCRWTGGILNNTASLGTSSTSIAVGTGSNTFTVGAGLNITTGNFLRIQSSAAPSAHMEGTVTSYSGTSLVVNVVFTGGTGTHADWNILAAAIYQAPMVLHSVTESVVENVRVTGNWYVGLLMDGWNPSTGGSLVTNYCTFRGCQIENVMNRGLYLYGTCNDNMVDGCFVQGGGGTTDYAYNQNPANAVGSVNSQNNNKVVGLSITATQFQGIEFGDKCFYNSAIGCTASGLTGSTSAGFIDQQANTGIAQYNQFTSCTAHACAGVGFEWAGSLYGSATGCVAANCNIGYQLTAQGGSSASHILLAGCKAIGCTTLGVWVTGSSAECSINSVDSAANGTNGIQIDSGCTNTLVTGRSVSNTGTNLVNNGTGTISTGLITT